MRKLALCFLSLALQSGLSMASDDVVEVEGEVLMPEEELKTESNEEDIVRVIVEHSHHFPLILVFRWTRRSPP